MYSFLNICLNSGWNDFGFALMSHLVVKDNRLIQASYTLGLVGVASENGN